MVEQKLFPKILLGVGRSLEFSKTMSSCLNLQLVGQISSKRSQVRSDKLKVGRGLHLRNTIAQHMAVLCNLRACDEFHHGLFSLSWSLHDFHVRHGEACCSPTSGPSTSKNSNRGTWIMNCDFIVQDMPIWWFEAVKHSSVQLKRNSDSNLLIVFGTQASPNPKNLAPLSNEVRSASKFSIEGLPCV